MTRLCVSTEINACLRVHRARVSVCVAFYAKILFKLRNVIFSWTHVAFYLILSGKKSVKSWSYHSQWTPCIALMPNVLFTVCTFLLSLQVMNTLWIRNSRKTNFPCICDGGFDYIEEITFSSLKNWLCNFNEDVLIISEFLFKKLKILKVDFFQKSKLD